MSCLQVYCTTHRTSFATTLRDHRVGIMNYYDYRISTGPLEGTNNRIRVLQRRA
ncbi:MAG: transposase [Synergistaceae bacterium]|nr:transposase [Synergistaceae bacterium]